MTTSSGTRWAATALGAFVALQVFVALVRGDRAVLFWWEGAPVVYVLFAWLVVVLKAAAAGIVVAWLFRRIEPALPGRDATLRPAQAALLVGLLTVVGGTLRFVAPVQVPPGVWLDVLMEAERLLRSPGEVPWLGGTPLGIANAHEIVSHLLLRVYDGLFLVLGRGDTGILSLSAVPGTLTVPAAAWLAYEAFGARAAVLSATFAAFSLRALALSRWGYTPATLVPLGLLAVAAALSARRRRSLLLAVLSGLFAGLAMHTHSSALIVPVALLAWAAGTWREPGARPRAAVAAGAALLAASPWLLGFAEHPGYVGGRLRDVSLGKRVRDVEIRDAGPIGRLASNAVDYSGLFVFTHDPNARHGLPGRPAATAALGVASLLGLAALSVRAVADPGPPRALLWLAAGSLAAGILSDPGGAPNTVRTCLLLPVGLVSGAWVVDGVVQAAARRVGARPAALYVLGAAAFFACETVPFFAVWADDRRVAAGFCPEESDAGRLLRRLGPGDVVLGAGTVAWPLVLETLAASADPRTPVPALPQKSAEALLAAPPRHAFWLVSPRAFARPLGARGWRVSRPVQVGPGRLLHVFRVAPAVGEPDDGSTGASAGAPSDGRPGYAP